MKNNFKFTLKFISSYKGLFLVSLFVLLLFSCSFVCVPFVYAQTTINVGDETTLRNAVNSATGHTTIVLTADIQLTATPLNVDVGKDITLTSSNPDVFFNLIGASGQDTLTVATDGQLELVGITVTHPSGATGPGVVVYRGGTLTLSGGTITNNTASGNSGGVVNVGNFTMSGGMIANNTGGDGGGIANYLGSVTISGGIIANNTAGVGGGIYNSDGTLTMSGGTIINNTAQSGGGINNGWNFTMFGGTVANNTARSNYYDYGGGICNWWNFTMFGGTVANNTAQSGGGINNQWNFTMFGGTVANNTAQSGGGIDNRSPGDVTNAFYGNFTVLGGTVANNTATNGGGIYIHGDRYLPGTVALFSGIISDNTAMVDGGGIWVAYPFLNRLFVYDGVVFSNNRASVAYDRDPIDDELYYTHIGTNVIWTVPFIQGYNNYDLSYTNGTPFALYNVTVNNSYALTTGAGSYPIGQTVTINAGTRAGYTFTNWTINQGNLTLPNTPIAAFFMPPTNIAITANWRATAYNITYVLNGGINNPANPNTYTVAELPLSIADPTRVGYSFVGWTVQYTNGQPDTIQSVTNYAIPAGTTGDIILTAHWTKVPQEGSFSVTKLATPPGDSPVFNFITSAPSGTFSLTDTNTWNSGPIPPGNYTLTELTPPNWALGNIIIIDPTNNSGIDLQTGTVYINLSPGENISIIYQNTQQAPAQGSFSVIKTTCPVGSSEPFRFVTSAPGGTFNLTDGSLWSSGPIAPGNYVVTEIVSSGWEITNIIVNDPTNMSTIDLTTGTVYLNLQAGNHVSIVYQDAQTPPQGGLISVVKTACPTGADTEFTFVSLAAQGAFSLSSGAVWTSNELSPGRYIVTEVMQVGWVISDIIVVDPSGTSTVDLLTGTATIDLQSGSHVTVIYQNTQQTPPGCNCNQTPCQCRSC